MICRKPGTAASRKVVLSFANKRKNQRKLPLFRRSGPATKGLHAPWNPKAEVAECAGYANAVLLFALNARALCSVCKLGSSPEPPLPETAVRRGRACPARSLAVVSPLTVCIVGRGLDPSAAFRPTIVTGSSVGEGFITLGAFAFPLASGPLPPTLSQLYHTLFPPPLQGVVKISLQIFLSICAIIEKV